MVKDILKRRFKNYWEVIKIMKKNKPLIIIHRVNKIKDLENIPLEYGVEIDVRGYANKMLLNHDPIDSPNKYDELEDYLRKFKHSFVIFNMKETGYEGKVIELAKKYNINDYFLLDVEFPYLYKATRKDNFRKIAFRYSEAEPIESLENQVVDGKTLLDWVWIDTNTTLPLNETVVEKLKGYKTCLVCPERWGRPDDILSYREVIHKLDFDLTAVMTSKNCVDKWIGK